MPSSHESLVVPPVMRRGLKWSLWLTVLTGTTAVAWVLLRDVIGMPRGFAYRYGALLVGTVPLGVIWGWWLFRTRHIRRAVAAGGRLCTHCAYDVSALSPSGTCPECGGPFDMEKDKALWKAGGARYDG